MRRVLALLALLLAAAAPARAQGVFCDSNTLFSCNLFGLSFDGTSTSVSGPFLFSSGSVTAPGAAFAANPTAGWYFRTASTWSYASSSLTLFEITSGDLSMSANRFVQWSTTSNNASTAKDLFLGRDAAATIQLGADVNGAAVNQAFKAHDGITGTDVKGASLTLESGLGTGAAVSNPLTLNRQVVGTTGTTAQTYAPAMVVCPTKLLSTVSATAQTIATVTTTSTTAGAVTMDYGNVASNGTLLDSDSGVVKVAWNNNAGTVAAAMTAVVLQADSDASGTLAATPTVTVATNVVSIKLTPTWVTIVPTVVTGYATFLVHSAGDTVVCQ